MKKILSILIAISLIISMFPAAFAEGAESNVETYSFTFRTGDSGNIGLSRNSTYKSSTRDYITRTIENTEYYLDSKYFTYATDLSVGNWKILDVSNDIITSSAGTASRFRMASSGQFQMTLNHNSGTAPLNIAFALKAPATAGFYIPTINYYKSSGYGPVTSDSTYKIFFDLLSEEKTLEDYSNAANEAKKTFTQQKTTSETAVYLDNEDDLVIAIKGANDEYRFRSVVLTQICNPTLTTSVDTETMTASVTVSGKTVVSDTETSVSMPVSNNFITYHSTDSDIASVNEKTGVITMGDTEGTAYIWAETEDGVASSKVPITVELPVELPPPSLDGEITYTENTHNGGDANVFTFNAFSTDGGELDVEFDESINITLGEKTTVSTDDTITVGGVKYNFLYWAKGATMAKKQIVSDVAEFDYLPGEGANYLIAVYEPETEVAETKVEFYNGNGQLLPNVTLIDGKHLPDYPSMAGYGTAYGWALKKADGTYTEYRAGEDVSELSGNLMFAAMYGEKEDITVFVDGAARNVKYGDKVTCTADSSKGTLMYWMKDGSVVSLEDTYSFLAWEDCRVEAVYGTEKPELSATKEMRKIVLDRFTAGNETAIMAEFIGFDDAVEKGIMFGNQKIAMSSKSSQFTVIDDATTENTAYGYAIIPDGTGYKILTDGIAHIGVDEKTIIAARRNAAESYMRKMTSVLWSPAEDITYSTGTSSAEFTLYKGRIYQGLPYVYTSGTYEGFMEFANDDDENGVYTVTGLTPDMMNGSGGIAPIGNDCSGALVRAWSAIGANIQAKTTKYMNEKYGFLKVGDYELLESDYDYSNRGTTAIASANGQQRIYEAYAKLQKADAVVHYPSTYGHSMMVVSVNVVRDPDGSINGASSTIKVHEQTKAYYKDNATTEIAGVGTVYKICGVDETYKFNELYSAGYLPITCRELVEATYIEDVRFNDTLGEESHTLRNLFNGTISCNKAIDEVKITITDENGTVQSAASTVKRENIFAFEMGQFTELEAAKIRGNIDVESLASGDYTCTVQVRIVGETQMHTVRDFTFTK